jgi:hypothetical protein
MTWDELVARLRASAQVIVDRNDLLTIIADLEQPVCIERGQLDDQTWVVLTAGVCERAKLDYERALRRSAGMATGAIVLIGEMCYVRHAAPIATLEWDDFVRVMQVLAAEAVRLRGSLDDKSSPLMRYIESPFTHYID